MFLRWRDGVFIYEPQGSGSAASAKRVWPLALGIWCRDRLAAVRASVRSGRRLMTRALQTIPQEPEDSSAEIYLTGAYFLLPFGCLLCLWRYTATRRTSGAPSGTRRYETGSRASAPTRTRGPGRRRRADDDAPSWGISIRYIGNNKPEVQKKLSKGYI